jgi:hypothetical protein
MKTPRFYRIAGTAFARILPGAGAVPAGELLAGLDLDPEHPLQPLCPAHGTVPLGRRTQVCRHGLAPPFRRDLRPPPTVRREHAVIPGQVCPWPWHQGGEARHEDFGAGLDQDVSDGWSALTRDLDGLVTRSARDGLPTVALFVLMLMLSISLVHQHPGSGGAAQRVPPATWRRRDSASTPWRAPENLQVQLTVNLCQTRTIATATSRAFLRQRRGGDSPKWEMTSARGGGISGRTRVSFGKL